MNNDEVYNLLKNAAVGPVAFWTGGKYTVYISDAGQLFATKICFDNSKFKKDNGYSGWHANHVIDNNHIKLLGWSHKFPPYEEQVCVLLPMEAHAKRFNSVVQSHGAGGLGVDLAISPEDVLLGYNEAYDLIGNYCGGGAARCKREMLAVVKVIVDRGSK